MQRSYTKKKGIYDVLFLTTSYKDKMIDFKKKLNYATVERKIEPCELYSTLDRKSVAGPLRPAQEYILKEWYLDHRDDKDLVIKLHTGEGKTLIGLLLLQSMINSKNGSCLYICPNIYLKAQVCDEAEKFGIPYCEIGDDNLIPDEFMCGEKILITYAHKVFNGKSIFGIDNNFINVGTVILDDSHACIDVIKDAQTISIKKCDSNKTYQRILSLFSDDLAEQREGSFLDIKNGNYDTFMLIPYWNWYDKKTEMLKILSEAADVSSVQFVWPLIRDRIRDYSCYISGNEIEIVPYNINVDMFGSFSKAKHRVLMSATTQDDAFFVKGLSFSANAVKCPLMFKQQKWSGEKMLIIPSIIDENCDRDLVVRKFAEYQNDKYGMVSLVPNTKKLQQYGKLGAICAGKNNIIPVIESLKRKKFTRLVVINNRYDGIDLPDESCRLLIIDSMPYFNSLSDKYEKSCRPNSEIINKKIAQKIEQGLGRGVRGEKDYCAILIIGSDIVKFMRSVTTRKYFSLQTQKQIDIGMEIAEMAIEDSNPTDNTMKPVISLLDQLLSRDEGWKEYYYKEMQSIKDEEIESSIYEQILEESNIEKMYSAEEYQKAADAMQNFIDKFEMDSLEKGWYLQQLARYYYPIRKEKSIEIQRSAFRSNPQLLKPQTGIEYIKISFINESRMNRISSYLCQYKNYSELMLAVNEILDNLTFGMEADKFESALKNVGELLGFVSQRPDMEIRKGPDNLWCGTNNEYAFFECKSEVEETRQEITKHEAGQMNNHSAWFEKEYGSNVFVDRYMLIPTKNLSYSGDFTHPVRIIRREKLKNFKESIKGFLKELSSYRLNDITYEKLQSLINLHHLNLNNIRELYSEEYYHKKES